MKEQMHMKKTTGLLPRLALGGVVALLGSCGTAANDQGVSFTITSFNAVDDEGKCQMDVGVSGVSFPLSSDTETALSSGNVYAPCVQMQNNMSTQFIRTERAYLSFYVEGASEQPPSTVTVLGTVIGPGSDIEPEGTTQTNSASTRKGTIPTGALSIANRVVAPIIVVPSETRSWMALNRASLPEPPFNMVITASVTGVTSAGDRMESNPLSINGEVTSDLVIVPTDGGDGTGGTGGTGG